MTFQQIDIIIFSIESDCKTDFTAFWIRHQYTKFSWSSTYKLKFQQNYWCENSLDIRSILAMRECRRQGEAHDYQGTMDNTVSGRICQRWDSQSPHDHILTNPGWFPDSSLDAAINYYRNPDGEGFGPWCYTSDSVIRWEYCAIDFCTGEFRITVQWKCIILG